jgi:hypothetical protein
MDAIVVDLDLDLDPYPDLDWIRIQGKSDPQK